MAHVEKTAKGKAKVERVRRALLHQEPDRVPFLENYWAAFKKRWREELGLPDDADPYRYYDVDVNGVCPNLDPHIRPFEILEQSEEQVVVRTGFGATVRKVGDFPMPEYVAFETDTIDKVNSFQFDDPWDDRRFFKRGDDHLNGVDDDALRGDFAPFVERARDLAPDFALFAWIVEANEFMTRAIGQANTLLWMGMYPEVIARFAERINEFELELLRAQIRAADGILDGIMLAGDIAYTRGMLFSPSYWRKYFKPGVAAMVKEAHDHGLPVIYHGCGDMSAILDDMVDIGVDCWHPVEAKTGLDVVDLRRRMGHALGFAGNNDVRVWTEGNQAELEAYTLRKLNAAKGGGYFFGADHSVPGGVCGPTYDYIVKLVRQHGNYPLRLGEYGIPDVR